MCKKGLCYTYKKETCRRCNVLVLLFTRASVTGRRKNYADRENPLPTLIKEKEPLWYWVPGTGKKKGKDQ